jgi:hypothetical protein
VTWPPPFDCTGALAGAWRVLELFDEFDEFELFDELEELDEFEDFDDFPELEEPAVLPELEFEAWLPEPSLDVPLPRDDVPVLVLVDELLVLVLVCVEPGRTAATAPAASTLAKPTVAVAVFSLRRPRSRSATARDIWRSPSWAYGDPFWSQLSIGSSVACLLVRVV